MLGHEPFRVVTPPGSLRHNALKAEFAGLGERDCALGGERFAEQNSADTANEPLERLPTLFDRALAQGQIDPGNGWPYPLGGSNPPAPTS